MRQTNLVGLTPLDRERLQRLVVVATADPNIERLRNANFCLHLNTDSHIFKQTQGSLVAINGLKGVRKEAVKGND